jgi:probable HAF family extracellular repeat protein
MKSVGPRAVIVGVCVWALAAGAGVQYKYSPAGNFPGSDYTVPFGVSKNAIVGYYTAQVEGQTILGAYIETLEEGNEARAKFTSVRPMDSRVAYLSGVNASAVAVGGFCPRGCNPYSGQHAFIYDHGKITAFDYPRVGAFTPTTTAYGINNKGQIVGGFCDQPSACPNGGGYPPTDHGFLDDHGTFTELDYPGTHRSTEANAINDAGQIVGVYDINNTGPHSFLYFNGQYQNIDYPNGAATTASAINNNGVVAGTYTDQFGINHGFTYQNGTFHQVNDHPDAFDTTVTGINDKGIIVGIWLPNPPKTGLYNFIGVPVR